MRSVDYVIRSVLISDEVIKDCVNFSLRHRREHTHPTLLTQTGSTLPFLTHSVHKDIGYTICDS